MRTLVVQAHPLTTSYNAALLDRVLAGLSAAGEPSELRRLAEGQVPSAADIDEVARLILVYPTWWGGQPAVLLDWLQQMVAGESLGSVAAIDVVTTHGSSRLVNAIQGAWGRRWLERQVAASCARGARVHWHALYKIDRRSAAELETFLAATEARFAGDRLPAPQPG